MYRVALDERGEQLTSREFAARVGQWEQQRINPSRCSSAERTAMATNYAGAPIGSGRWARLTFQHELALVLVRGLYRAYAIKGGLPLPSGLKPRRELFLRAVCLEFSVNGYEMENVVAGDNSNDLAGIEHGEPVLPRG